MTRVKVFIFTGGGRLPCLDRRLRPNSSDNEMINALYLEMSENGGVYSIDGPYALIHRAFIEKWHVIRHPIYYV